MKELRLNILPRVLKVRSRPNIQPQGIGPHWALTTIYAEVSFIAIA